MKSTELGTALRAFAGILDAAGARQARDQIAAVTPLFDAAPTSTVSAVMKGLGVLPASDNPGSPNLGDVARLLSSLQGLLRETAKASVVKDIDLFERLLRDRAPMEIRAFVSMGTEALGAKRTTRKGSTPPPVREHLVIHYRHALEALLGKEEEFKVAYDELSSNLAIGKGELIAIAKQMTGASPRSKAEALKKIWSMHQSLLTAKAKSRATGGRSAA
ncbi:MAG TPA: hypothetical protein VKP67_19750 [Xanthobacteraceae bacterium]|nr:hypothetical protein [Xanthobacteraceae bacterium]